MPSLLSSFCKAQSFDSTSKIDHTGKADQGIDKTAPVMKTRNNKQAVIRPTIFTCIQCEQQGK
jgi:hypothetical protein